MTNLLSVEEVATRLKIRPLTVYRWARQGQLPSVKLAARSLRFNENDIEKFIESKTCRIENTSSDQRKTIRIRKPKGIRTKPGQIAKDRASALVDNAINEIIGSHK